MRYRRILPVSLLLLITSAALGDRLSAQASYRDFSGVWVLDVARSHLSPRRPGAGPLQGLTLTIQDKRGVLVQHRTVHRGGKAYSWSYTFFTDGRVAENHTRQKALLRTRGYFHGNRLFLDSWLYTRLPSGKEARLPLREVWSLHRNGSELRIELTRRHPSGRITHDLLVFRRVAPAAG
jgi:hypothetical protein